MPLPFAQLLIGFGIRPLCRQTSLHSGIQNTCQGCKSTMWHRMAASLYSGHAGEDTLRRLETAQRQLAWFGTGAYGGDQVCGGSGAGLVEGCQARADPASPELHHEA